VSPGVNDWYESEPPLGRLWVADLRRLKHRAKTRLLLIFAITLGITGAAAHKFSKRGHNYEAAVFLAIDESALSGGRHGVPGRELLDYVANVLITDQGLADLANRRNLHPLRRKFGDEYAVAELREQFEIEVIQNDYAERRIADQARTAHVLITAYDASPEEATVLVNDIAEISVKTSRNRYADEAKLLTADIADTISRLRAEAEQLSAELAEAKRALHEARLAGDPVAIARQSVRFERADQQWRRADGALKETSRIVNVEASAEVLQEAGLGIEAKVVDRQNAGALVDLRFGVAIAVAFVFFGSLVAVSLLVGAFDARIHEPQDISRLGLPVLGHVPDFPGQTVGSLQQRGVRRHRVPSFLRWRRS
jgi:capsular polysaccharide biosynthesis protein